MTVRVNLNNFKDIPEKVGLKDCGHVILSCSACGKPLVDIWLIKPNAIDPAIRQPFRWKGKAICCYCGDESFPEEWQGRFASGPYGQDIVDPDPEAMNDSRIRHVIRQIEPVEGMLVFHTRLIEQGKKGS